MKKEIGIAKFLRNLKDYNLYFEEDGELCVLEECDDVYDLFHEIQIQLFNNLFNSLNDLTNPEYLKTIEPFFILDKNKNRIYLKEFIPFIYQENGEWNMIGQTNLKNTLMAKIKVIGKTSDCCLVTHTDDNGKTMSMDGYVPEFATDENYGSDYISLEIDAETGQILDWERRKPQLEQYITDIKNRIQE